MEVEKVLTGSLYHKLFSGLNWLSGGPSITDIIFCTSEKQIKKSMEK